MSFITSTSAIFPYLYPGLYASQMIYNMYDTEYSALYKKGYSNRAFEVFVHSKPLGAAPEKPEGTPTYIDDTRVMWQFSAAHKFFGTSFDISYEAQRFNLYDRDYPQQLAQLTNSHTQTRNYRAVEPLVNGFNTAAVTYDGQPLFSTQHPTAVGVYANTIGVPTQFEESALEDIEISLAGMTDDAGNIISMSGSSVIVSPKNMFNAPRVLDNPDRPATTNRDINALYKLNRFPDGINVNHYLGNDWDDWYVKTRGGSAGLNDGGGALFLIADELRIDPHADEKTKIISFISYESYMFVIWNNRQFFGVQGLS